MPALVEVPAEKGRVLIEVWRPRSDVAPVTSNRETITELKESVRAKLRPVLELAKEFHQELDALQVKSAEVEFGFSLTSKGSVFVVALESEATFKVKLVFEGNAGGAPKKP